MESSAARMLVLGIGNVLAGDDGVGPAVAAALAAAGGAGLPPGTEVLDGGTLGLGLLPWLADRDVLVLVDAAELGAAPGTVRVLEGAALAVATGAVGPGAVADLLAAATLAGVLPLRVALVAIQPASLEAGTVISAAVSAALPAAVSAAREVAWRLAARGPDQAQANSPHD